MAQHFVTYQGKRFTPYMAWVLEGVDQWLRRHYNLRLVVNDGIRTYAEQEAMFFSRYVRASDVNGRRVYDVRWYKGVLWYRIDSRGTVAPPDSPLANHLIQGSGSATRAAADISDSGRDAGITVKTSARGRAIRAAAKSLHIEFEGDAFGEGWHILIRNIWQPVPQPPAPKPTPTPAPEQEEEDDDMAKNSGFVYTRSRDEQRVVLLSNTTSGWWMEYISSDSIVPNGNNPIAATMDTGSFAEVSEAWATAHKASLPRAQGVVVSGALATAEPTE